MGDCKTQKMKNSEEYIYNKNSGKFTISPNFFSFFFSFFCGATDPSKPRPICFEVSRSHTDTHTHTHTPGTTPLNKRSACRRGRYLHTIQQTQDTNTHTLYVICTCNPSIQAVADLSLRLHSYWDWQSLILFNLQQ